MLSLRRWNPRWILKTFKIKNMKFLPYQNFIDNTTKRNFTKMMRLSIYYDLGLNEIRTTNPLAASIYAISHPRHLAYTIKYNQNRSAAGTVHGKVFTKDELATELNHTRIGDWDYEFQKIHREGTVEYETCWIGGHAPITHGPMEARINNILLLTEAMMAYPELDILRAVIEAFYVLIHGADDQVTGKKSLKTGAKGNVESERILNAIAMFKGYGLMISQESTDAYMDAIIDRVSIQQKAEQMVFNAIIGPHRKDKIASRTLLATDTFEAINNGTEELKFFVSRFLDDPHGIFVSVAAGDTKVFAAADLGNIAYRYIMVQNDSLTNSGHYSFRFID